MFTHIRIRDQTDAQCYIIIYVYIFVTTSVTIDFIIQYCYQYCTSGHMGELILLLVYNSTVLLPVLY